MREPIPKKYLQTCLSNSWGGLEMVAFELACSFAEKGLNLTILGFKNSPLQKHCLEKGITFIPVDKSAGYFKRIRIIRQVIKSQNIDTLILQKLPSLKFIVPATLFLKKQIRIYGFSHILINVDKKDFLHKFLYARLTKIFSMTEIQSQRLLKHLPIKESQIEIIPNWISKEKIKSSVPINPTHMYKQFLNKTSKPNKFTAVMTSRLDPQKGQDLAIQAVYLLKKQGLDIQLFIAGENTKNELDFQTYLETLILRLNVQDSVFFLGYHENLFDIYKKADVLIVPSWEETFGRVIIEAMAVGLPSIASRAGGVPNIIQHQKNGLLFETKKPEALTEQIFNYIKNSDLQQKIKSQCLIDSQKYSKEIIVNKLIEIVT